MDIFIALLIPVVIPFVIYAILSIVGHNMEKNHEKSLAEREAAIGHFPLFDLASVPPGMTASAGQLVSGNAVLGTGWLKQFFASFRAFVGGEIVSYQRVLQRARREAQLRMIEEARSHGATAIINVRYETSDVGGVKPFSEVMCYGTMIR